jgi:hypothetical protein
MKSSFAMVEKYSPRKKEKKKATRIRYKSYGINEDQSYLYF